jgi:hypothetical protein
MLGAAIIVFRETLEAALILGIIAAATRGVIGCVFHGNWTLIPEQTGQSERSDAGVVFYS